MRKFTHYGGHSEVYLFPQDIQSFQIVYRKEKGTPLYIEVCLLSKEKYTLDPKHIDEIKAEFDL